MVQSWSFGSFLVYLWFIHSLCHEGPLCLILRPHHPFSSLRNTLGHCLPEASPDTLSWGQEPLVWLRGGKQNLRFASTKFPCIPFRHCSALYSILITKVSFTFSKILSPSIDYPNSLIERLSRYRTLPSTHLGSFSIRPQTSGDHPFASYHHRLSLLFWNVMESVSPFNQYLFLSGLFSPFLLFLRWSHVAAWAHDRFLCFTV